MGFILLHKRQKTKKAYMICWLQHRVFILPTISLAAIRHLLAFLQ